MKRASVIGAGTMGASIAQVFAAADYQVTLADVSMEYAQKGKMSIENRLLSLVQKGKIDDVKMKKMLSRIVVTDCLQSCKDSEIMIEAVAENMQLKQKIFSELEEFAGQDALLVSNTSSLSVTEIASVLERPERFLGMHFFNPASVMHLVEVISGEHTGEKYVERTMEIADNIGKTPVMVKESAGFVVNRILIPMINEAIGVYAEGVANIQDIDTAMKLGANHPMGPLALGDLVGLDVVLDIMQILQAETGEDKYRPHPLLRKMVRAGKLGKKTKIGFYDYH
ncbi:MAG: 3-hydroxyacyl-CoA dehydrogenase NAD-binding domain-containing protein [Christensenella sp.]|nr:3-hydroxyacyl-CoA dehydrogenase NAD-binding domain-containing protein [Christensenella sp.]